MPHRQDKWFLDKVKMKEWIFDEVVKILKEKCGKDGDDKDPIVYNVIRYDVDGFMNVYYSIFPHVVKDKVIIKIEGD